MRCFIIAVLVLINSPVIAQQFNAPFTAQDLLNLCTGNSAEQSECSAYIKGVRTGMTVQRQHFSVTLARVKIEPPNIMKLMLMIEPFCVPRDLFRQDATDAVVAFIKGLADEKRNHAAGYYVFLALIEKYPCTRNPKDQ